MQHKELIDSPASIAALAEQLKDAPFIAIDTEFIREKTFFPTLELMQIANRDDSWLIDARAFIDSSNGKPLDSFQPLLDLLESPNSLKIFHAAQADQECLYTSFGVTACPTLDTALAASLLGYGDNISLRNLLRQALGVRIKKGHARSHWSLRPLPEQLIDYAHADVVHLVELGEKLLAELDEQNRRPWAMALSAEFENPALYEPQPEEIAKRLSKSGRITSKTFPVLVELARWREHRIRHLNIPRKWLMDDGVLLDLAEVRPKELKHLETFRGIPKDEVSSQGPEILAAIQRGVESQPQKPAKAHSSNHTETRTVELLRCFLEMLSEQHGIASRFLISPRKIYLLFLNHFECAQDLVDQEILTPQASELIGEELVAFMHGRRALTLHNGSSKIIKTQDL
ncbi:MAG: HRDC domain-containing protein [Candidatus Hinthialibacter antarcticus]|nr:HRDC domain-containing protein [Candidatus Hinthialibacter antarcticus]